MVAAHNRILRDAIRDAGGVDVRTEGDALFAAFSSAPAAAAAAARAQRALAAHPWPQDAEVRVRMGLHTGEGVLGGDDYVGLDVHRAARISAAGHGGQVVLSSTTHALVEGALPDGVTLRDLGEHRLKDFDRPERLWQLVVPGLPAEFPPLRTLEVPTTLPPYLTGFVGRDRELSLLEELLQGARLLTLTGPGGTGKTRLSVEMASRARGSFPDGVFFVDLSAVADPRLVASAVAAALGVHEEGGRPVLETLEDHLRDRTVLLVLDNFEQVLEGADAVSAILAAGPGITALATSRAPLGLAGEREVPVPPLDVPPAEEDPQRLAGSEAVALFAQRALEVDPEFSLTDETAPAVAEICRRLDGLPLAIELAASRVRVLPPRAMLPRLERRLPLLTGGPRDAPARQRTLREAIAWSEELLAEPLRRLFARLSVFAGGCTVEAAEAVADPEGELGLDVLQGIEDLLTHSLVRRTADGDEPRFGMLETIREYAQERLEGAGETEEIGRRHAERLATFAEAAEPHLVGEAQADWLDRVDREHDNVRTALRRCVEMEDPETGIRIAAPLWRYWQQRGFMSEGRRWVDSLLELPRTLPQVRFRGLIAGGGLAYWQRAGEADRYYEEALYIARELGDRRLEMEAIYNKAFVPLVEAGDLDTSTRLMEESLTIARELGARETEAAAQTSLAWVWTQRGDYETAMRLTEEALATHRELGNRWQIVNCVLSVGQIRRLKGDLAEARRDYLEALAMLREAGERPLASGVLTALSALESTEGAHERAMRLWGAAEALREEVGTREPSEIMQVGDPVAAARVALGDSEAESHLAAGRALTLEEAVAYAEGG